MIFLLIFKQSRGLFFLKKKIIELQDFKKTLEFSPSISLQFRIVNSRFKNPSLYSRYTLCQLV
jgi:hypothetical protein